MVYIDWDIVVWWVLTCHSDNGQEFQRYRNNELIPGEESNTYILLLTDQWQELTCTVRDWTKFETAEPVYIDYYNLEIKPIQKEYVVKLYDWSMNFLKVLPASIITNDISFSESIDSWQWQLVLNINLPIDTDYFDNVRYCKVYMFKDLPQQAVNYLILENYDFLLTENWWNFIVEEQPVIDFWQLLYSWRLSKVNRTFSNNKENIQITFLGLYTLLNDIYFEQDWSLEFQIEDDPANIIKTVIDYFNTKYPWILSYTEESIDTYWNNIYLEFNNTTCAETLKSLMEWLNWYLFVWADWVIQFHEIPQIITHNFTYEKDVTALTIPEDYEQVANAVMATYKEEWWLNYLTTSIATDNASITKFWRKEVIVNADNAYWETAWETYRDSYLNEYKDWKKNITLTVSTLYPIESIHPGDTIRIRNIDLSISNLKISKVEYTYEQVKLSLEYYTSIAKQIFNS